MKHCPYDTNHDGDCHLCSKPGWHCNGEHPEHDETGEPMRSIIADNGTFTPSTHSVLGTEWDFTDIELIEIVNPHPEPTDHELRQSIMDIGRVMREAGALQGDCEVVS